MHLRYCGPGLSMAWNAPEQVGDDPRRRPASSTIVAVVAERVGGDPPEARAARASHSARPAWLGRTSRRRRSGKDRAGRVAVRVSAPEHLNGERG